jgi:hypothetical protein
LPNSLILGKASQAVSARTPVESNVNAGAGSHNLTYKPTHRRITCPSRHRNYQRRTLKSVIEKQARWNKKSLKRLGLLPSTGSTSPL